MTNSYKDLVPDYYTRKQTLANAERYITPELKELEDMILGAEDKLYALEYELYSEVRETIAGQVERIQQNQLPHWMRSVLLHLLQSATTMSVRKLMKKESLISKKAVIRSLSE